MAKTFIKCLVFRLSSWLTALKYLGISKIMRATMMSIFMLMG